MNAQTLADFTVSLSAAFDARAAFEKSKSEANTSIQTCIANMRKSMQHDTIAQVLLNCAYDVNSINRSERVNVRRNVYSIEKDDNIARFIAKLEALNHYTLAIFKSAFALEKNDMLLTHKCASAACSEDVKHSDSKREKIIAKHRYAKHISANTASTQSSSSVNALEALNVLTQTTDASMTKAYRLNRESAAFVALAKALDLK